MREPAAKQDGLTDLHSVTELLGRFGLSSDYIHERLSCAASIHNAFESLKLEALIAYEDMDPEDKKMLKTESQRLSKLTIKSVTRESDMRERMIDNLLHLLNGVHGRCMLNDYIDMLEKRASTQKDERLHLFLTRLKRKPE